MIRMRFTYVSSLNVFLHYHIYFINKLYGNFGIVIMCDLKENSYMHTIWIYNFKSRIVSNRIVLAKFSDVISYLAEEDLLEDW